MRKPPLKDRLLSKREITPSGCWIFTGYKNYSGYGMIHVQKKVWRVHVLAFQLFVGPSTGNICHKSCCTSRACFNPEHLYEGDQKSNYEDSIQARTHYNLRHLRKQNGSNRDAGSCG